MLFNSLPFLFFFVSAVAVYFALPYKFRWIWLLCVSYYFYLSLNGTYVFLIFLTTLVTYYAGLKMGSAEIESKRKRFLILSLVFNLGLLFLFKYYYFFNNSLRTVFDHYRLSYPIPELGFLLPLGISFYLFKSVSYTLDVYRRNLIPERNIGIFALYVAFFPQLLAGPIERAARLLPQFYEKFDFDYHRVKDGLKLMLWGFFQKMVIADNLALLVDPVYNLPIRYQGTSLMMATLFYSIQIYCDFSGYSDIAIGAGQVLGFRTMDNFHLPYFSQSIPEFWRRWHISLSTWLRDYLYIPLGGNRVSISRWYFNLFIVLLICGLWHGANWTFMAWGGLHGCYLILSAMTQKIRKKICEAIGLDKVPRFHHTLRIIVTFLLVSFAWIFFRANTMSDAFYIISNLLSGWEEILNLKDIPLWRTLRFELVIGLTSVGILVGVQLLQRHGDILQMLSRKPAWFRWLVYYFILLSILLSGNFGQKQFIYFQF